MTNAIEIKTWQKVYRNMLSNPITESDKADFNNMTKPADYDVIFEEYPDVVLAISYSGYLNLDVEGECTTAAIGTEERRLHDCVMLAAREIAWISETGKDLPEFIHPSWHKTIMEWVDGKSLMPGQGLLGKSLIGKGLKMPEQTPLLVGGINPNGNRPVDLLYRNWKIGKACDGCWVIGRKDNSEHCFSVQKLEQTWDIAFYYGCTPRDVQKALKTGESTYAGCAEYHESDPRNKYLGLDLIKILQAEDIPV